MISTIFLITVFLILVVFAGFFLVQFYNIIFRGFAPFISTHRSVIDLITSELTLAPGKRVYELGCGTANFLVSLEKKFPQAEFTGIEYAFWPWLIARIQLSFKKSQIKLLKQNFLNTDLSQADLIYCYLNPGTMLKLEDKLKKECRPGTVVISYAFPITHWQPTKTTNLGDKTSVFFYQI